MTNRYQKRPSEILNIEDEYVAYCFDEAMDEYLNMLEKGKKPRFKSEGKDKKYNPGLKMLIGLKGSR